MYEDSYARISTTSKYGRTDHEIKVNLPNRFSHRGLRDPAPVLPSQNLSESFLSPVFSPGVLDKPVGHSVVISIANDSDSVSVHGIVAVLVLDDGVTHVILEGGADPDAHGHRSSIKHEVLHELLVAGNNVLFGELGGGGSFLAFALLALVGGILLQGEAVLLGLFEGPLDGATAATAILNTLDHLLGGEARSSPTDLGIHRFHYGRRGEGPAEAALSLVSDW